LVAARSLPPRSRVDLVQAPKPDRVLWNETTVRARALKFAAASMYAVLSATYVDSSADTGEVGTGRTSARTARAKGKRRALFIANKTFDALRRVPAAPPYLGALYTWLTGGRVSGPEGPP